MSKILVITGPTASGKTDVAIQIAEQFNGEIVSADSMQIYRGLDVGTAKPTIREQKKIPHHLIDVVNMTDNFSVAEFVALADEIIEDITKRGKLPIIVGGTGFYLKALLGLQALEYSPNDPNLSSELADKTLPQLVDELLKIDDVLAKRIDFNNRQRVIRAIQIAHQGYKQQTTVKRPTYDALVVGLDWPREILYQRINQRVTNMVSEGVLNEAQAVLNAGGEELQAGKAIGYKEFFGYLRGEKMLEEAIKKLQQDSRRYAKRQLTYLRHQLPGLMWINGKTAILDLKKMIQNWL
ncbi:tRNA (adenosine(37)-N6)-dimethylallyltransferase MiaA [Leuconostoc pseudomesenteroides]|uniref:tRNA (adenosine(37)-N6)-dimethylallyltransferase MiaA n=1 Tax=Leuconostoc pseudomesenteroides TaxID=33968 RepID=UPI0039EA870B